MTLPQTVVEGEPQLEENLILYKRRWLILIVYSIASFLNATLLTTFAPISPLIVDFYGLSEDQVDILSMLFVITFLPGILIAVYLSRGHGFATCFKVGALFQAIGTAIRMFTYIVPSPSPTFWYVMMFIGQIICGLSQPMLTSIATQLANQWFAKHESIAAQFAGSLSNPLGIAMGAIFSRAVVNANSTVDNGLQVVVISQALMSGLILILGLMYFDENPPTPPSTTAIAQWQDAQYKLARNTRHRSEASLKPPGEGDEPTATEQSFDDDVNNVTTAFNRHHVQDGPVISLTTDNLGDDEIGFWEHFKETMGPAWKDFKFLMKSKDFLCLAIPFSLGMTIFNAIVSLPNKVISPFTPVDASNMTATIICVGLVSCIVWSVILEVTKQFRLCLKLGFVLAGSAVAFFFSQLHKDMSGTYLYLLFCGLGFFIIPLLPLTIENAQESTYPMPAQIVSAILLSFGQLPSIPFLFIFMSLLKQDDYTSGNPLRSGFGVVITSLLVTALLMVMFYTGESRRQQALNMSDGEYAEMQDEGSNDETFMGISIGGLFGGANSDPKNTSNERTGLLNAGDDDHNGDDRVIKFNEPVEGDIDADIAPIKPSKQKH